MDTSSFYYFPLLAKQDPEVATALYDEGVRQQNQIELIASENIVSKAVLQAQGSVLTNKYAEGYSNQRYYGGCHEIDKVENLAIERLCTLYECGYANVQPHSGAQANQAIFLALLNPGDCLLGMSLSSGGHLTHGARPNISGKWFKAVSYGVNSAGIIDMDEVRILAKECKPKLIIAGGSAYPRQINFAAFREIADEVGAFLMVDMAHYAGLVAGKCYDSPLPYADVVSSTTHKTLRGPRGGIILTNDPAIAKKIDAAVFPGLQGGPLMHVIAAKAVAFKEALQPEFKRYAHQVVHNSKVLADHLQQQGLTLVSGGTDCHMVLLDLSPQQLSGKQTEQVLEHAGMTCNKNSIPNDPLGPRITSGIRLGTPAVTTRGFGPAEMIQISTWIHTLVTALQNNTAEQAIQMIRPQSLALCQQYPIYQD